MSSKPREEFTDPPLSEEEAALVAAEDDASEHALSVPLRALALEEPESSRFADAVMARVAHRDRSLWQRFVHRLRQPASRRQTVLTAVPLAAVVGLVTFFLVRDAVTIADSRTSAASDLAGDMFPVSFELRAPNATRVTLSGDFNNWSQESISLSDADGDGVWKVTVTLPRGRYAYQFVIDGKQRIADPNAPRETVSRRGDSAILEL